MTKGVVSKMLGVALICLLLGSMLGSVVLAETEYYTTKEEAISQVPTHVVPKGCFVWKDGPAATPWRVIPGTGCAHWVAHELGLGIFPSPWQRWEAGEIEPPLPPEAWQVCYDGFYFRVADVIAGRTEVEIKDAIVGDIWTYEDLTHTGIVRQVEDGKVLVEHCSSAAGGVVQTWFSSGKCWRIPLDLVFVIDTTGSMWDDIAAVKVSATDIINLIDSKVAGYRLALVAYKDFPVWPYGEPSDYPAMTRLSFTSDRTAAINAINALSAWGGADWQESVYSALIYATLDPSVGGWRDGVSKQIILMGDAPPHDPEPFTDYTLQDFCDAAASVDPAIVQAIAIGGDTATEEAFSNIASGTNGKLFTAATADEVVEAVMDAIGEAIEPGPPTDTIPPSIEILPGISPNYTQGTPLSYVATDDGGSGLASSNATLDGVAVTNPVSLSIPGTHTYVVTAVDHAGNVATRSISFNVYAFSWRPPLDKGATRKIQLNSTLPVKFSVLDASGNLVVDSSLLLTLYDDTGSQRLGPFVYGINNPNMYVDSQHKQYIHTLHTNNMGLVAGMYEIRVTFDSASLIGRNSIWIEIVGGR